MLYRFDGFEVDTVNREVRRQGSVRPLQPQAFALLAYLIRHRDRVVEKRELLAELWPDTVVGEGSIQRAVHLVRKVLDDDGTRIRTVPKMGYRFDVPVEEVRPGATQPAFLPRFAKSSDDVHIAYHTVGQGGLDLVLVPGWVFPMRAMLDHPELSAFVDELTRFGRVVLFDKRGTGLSDRVKDLPTMEQRMDDLRAVLDAVRSREALLVGWSEGGPLCLLFATSWPERTRGLLLVGSFARWAAAPGYPHGWSLETITHLREYIGHAWGTGETVAAIVESRASDPETLQWAARAEQEGASPGAALELLEMNLQIDVRPLLPAVSVPVAVLHHVDDGVITVDNARRLAADIPGARLLEVEGRDHSFLFEGREHLFDALKWLMARRGEAGDRFLTTVVAVEVDTEVDADAVDAIVTPLRGVRAEARKAWSFDGPQRAIRCAQAVSAWWAAQGISVRVGVHTAEVVRKGSGLSGDGVDTAIAIARAAESGEVRVSGVVRDLVHGAPLRFEPRDEVHLPDDRAMPTLALIPG